MARTNHVWWKDAVILDSYIYDKLPRLGQEAGHADGADGIVDEVVESILERRDPLSKACFSACDVRQDVLARIVRLREYRYVLAALLVNQRGIEQRSPQWYEARKSLITASDAAQALGEGKFGTRAEFFQKKLDAILAHVPKAMNMNLPPLKWGIKYEPVAAYLYSHLFGLRLHEFGLLVHPEFTFIGASPDGISEAGIMVEIKCPYRRKITGEVPGQYYMQMQLQLAVCGLRECDYFECEIEESDVLDASEPYTGRVSSVMRDNGDTEYTYQYRFGPQSADWSLSCDNVSWKFFSIVKFNVIRVRRDDMFLNAKVGALRRTWEQLQEMVRAASSGTQESSPVCCRRGGKAKESWEFVDSD
jgi:putative phage-type endonuclease